jgi:hypothetical protein
MPFNPKWLVGKTIERVDMRSFDDGRGRTTHNPRITFTDGTALTFGADELEHGDGYGIALNYHPKNPRPRKPTKDTPPIIIEPSPELTERFWRQTPDSMRQRLVGRSRMHMLYEDLDSDLRDKVRDYLNGGAPPMGRHDLRDEK